MTISQQIDNTINLGQAYKDNSEFLGKFDIVIVGAGCIGLTAALILSASSRLHKIALIDEKAILYSKTHNDEVKFMYKSNNSTLNNSNLFREERSGGRLFSIGKRSCEILEKLGVMALLEPHIQPIKHIRVNEAGTHCILDFKPEAIGADNFGVMVEENILRATLLEALQARIATSALCARDHVQMQPGRIEDDQSHIKSAPRDMSSMLADAGADMRADMRVDMRVDMRENVQIFEYHTLVSVDRPNACDLSIKREQVQEAYNRDFSVSSHVSMAPTQLTLQNLKLTGGNLSVGRDLYRISADLVIGADGKNSTVRQLLGIKCKSHDYEQIAIVCDIEHEFPHNGVAVEKFFTSGPFAILPKKSQEAARFEDDQRDQDIARNTEIIDTESALMSGDTIVSGSQLHSHNLSHISSLVWMEHAKTKAYLEKLNPDEILGLIRDKMDGYLGGIKLRSGVKVFALTHNIAETCVSDNIVLIGDAAHFIHPVAGQGVNVGLRDVDCLADMIFSRIYLGLPICSKASLVKYESDRKLDVLIMLGLTYTITKTFGSINPAIMGLRKLGLTLFEHIPSLKKIAMKYAAGIMKPNNLPSVILEKIKQKGK